MVLRKTDLLAILPTGYRKSLINQLFICFLADGLNILPQALATDLPICYFKIFLANFTNIVTIAFFLDRLPLAFSQCPTVDLQFLKIYFSRAKQQKQEVCECIGTYRFCHKRSGVILIG